MSKYSNINGRTILSITPPTKKLHILLEELSMPSFKEIKNAPFEQKRLLVLVAFREFLKGNLLLEEFSEVANHLKMLFPIETRTQEQTDYELMIYEAADISLYVRKFDTEGKSMFNGVMNSTWNYFNKYKDCLNSISEKYSEPSPLEDQ